jgi:TonB family protein
MPPSKRLPIAALALGLVGLFTAGLLVLGALVGLSLAILALVNARRDPERYAGADVAWAALAANAFALLTVVPVVVLLMQLRPLFQSEGNGLPEPVAETQRFFEEPAAPVPPPPPPPPPAPGAAVPGVTDPLSPVRVGGNIPEPRKRVNVNPVYPQIAKQARVQGIVILECTIDTRGRVTNLRVLRSIPLLDEAAVTAVRQWEYEPTRLDGRPVPVIMTVTVNFMLR